MKLKDGFILRQVAGENVVVPFGETLNLNAMITLNETGVFLWKLLEEETTVEELTAALLKEYDVDEASARKYAGEFVEKLKGFDFLA